MVESDGTVKLLEDLSRNEILVSRGYQTSVHRKTVLSPRGNYLATLDYELTKGTKPKK